MNNVDYIERRYYKSDFGGYCDMYKGIKLESYVNGIEAGEYNFNLIEFLKSIKEPIQIKTDHLRILFDTDPDIWEGLEAFIPGNFLDHYLIWLGQGSYIILECDPYHTGMRYNIKPVEYDSPEFNDFIKIAEDFEEE